MGTIATRSGASLYFKDRGAGRPVVFSHGWPLSSDSWEAAMLHLASSGFRCVAHDRRGHGDDDRIVPIGAAGFRSAKLVEGATLKVYQGAPHGLADTHKDRLHADLLAFLAT